MSRPTLEVADIVRAVGNRFWISTSHTLHGYIARCSMPSSGAAPRHWAVIWISASAAAIRPSHSLMPQSALPQVSGQRARKMARGALGRTIARPILPRRLHTAARTVRPCPPEQATALRPALPHQRSDDARTGSRPEALGADIGFLGVLHTWGQNLEHHPHVHYIVPAGGLALDGSRWIDSSCRFFLPVHALSRVFAASSRNNSVNCSNRKNSSFTAHSNSLPHLAHSATSSGNCSARTGSSTPSHPSEVPNMFSTTWPATPSRCHLQPSSRGVENDRVSFRWRDYPTAARRRS